MKLSIIKSIFACAIISVSTATFALPDISGHWTCHSKDPVSKKSTTASGEITKTGDTYSLINWKDEGSNDARSGTGIHNAKLKDSFAVMFWSNDHAEDIGFGLYQIKSNNKIVGMWTMKNAKVVVDETCERAKA